MSMENELKRIADALERIADAKANAPVTEPTATVTMVDEGTPVAKRKSTKYTAPAAVATVKAKPAISTGAELMGYCNTKLVGIKDPTERTATIKAVVKMFSDKYGVKAIRDLADDKVAAAKADFDALVGGE